MRHRKTEIERGPQKTHVNSTFWCEHCHLEGTELVLSSELLVQALDMRPEHIQILGWISERHKLMNKHVHDGAIEDLPGFATYTHDMYEKEIRMISIRLV